MNVIDLFSGVGGFSSGFRKAGFDVIVANEIDPMIADSYCKNHLGTLMINQDIEKFADNIDGIIEENLKSFDDKKRGKEIKDKLEKVDVIIGGPPCQGFSMAGARIRKTNEFIEDPRNYLFKYYFKLIQHFEPNYFIMENVQGLETMKNGSILNQIIEIFTDEDNFRFGGYHLTKTIISSDELGVPQKRRRFILIGSKFAVINIEEELKRVKEKLNIPDKVTLYDAISDLPIVESNEGEFLGAYTESPKTSYQMARRKDSKILYNHVGPNHNEIAIERMKKINPGENWTKLSEEEIKSVHSGAYGRLEWDKVSPTITTRFDTPSAGRVIHPTLNRALTPREAARIQSFDDDFVFYGNKTSVGKQIGNAVPPLVGEVLANIIKDDAKKRTV